MTKHIKNIQNYYQFDDDFVRFYINLDDNFNNNYNSGKTLFVIDKSGSMSGEWKQVLSAVQYMREGGNLEPDFIVYDSYSRRVSGSEVLTLSAGGGTNFENAFKTIQEYMNEISIGSHVNIVFMTDGQNNGGNLENGIKILRAYLASCRRSSCIHTIGFSSSHDRKFLDRLKQLGSTEGVYRYAEKANLDEKFSELFDFMSISCKVDISIGNISNLSLDCSKINGKYILDVLLKKQDIDSNNSIFNDKHLSCILNIKTNDILSFEIDYNPLDLFFTVRKVEEMEIVTQDDLDNAQLLMKNINPSKAPKDKRRELLELKMIVQAKLDKFHQLFAEIARGLISGDNISAQLNSLRHESKFSKARRARAMDKRIASNIDEILAIEDELEKLPPPNLNNFKDMDLICSLSGSSILELMEESNKDFLVFPLRISRPEQAIDAPTQIIIEKLLIGHYSFDAFKDSVSYAISNVGSLKALGGFTEANHSNDTAVGLFRGPDGELTNACLPYYINDDHWKRVEIQLKPILGYFFTMDPLGYKGDQLIALYMILGNMLCRRANGEFVSEYADNLIDDFTKTCTAIKPFVQKYLSEGRYSGRIRNDLLDEFIISPTNRTKEAMNNILVIIGLYHCSKNKDNNDNMRFNYAFVEEVWRRNFTSLFKGQPRNQIDEWLESLLFLDNNKLDNNTTISTDNHIDDSNNNNNNISITSNMIKLENKKYIEWGKAKLGLLGKKKNQELLKKYPKGPYYSKDNKTNNIQEEYKPRELINYEDHKQEIDILVNNILSQIKNKNLFLSNMYDGIIMGNKISGIGKYLMLIQALKYSNNSAMNQAVNNGSYKNTYDYLYPEDLLLDKEQYSTFNFIKEIYERFEEGRKNDWNAIITKKLDFNNAKFIAMCPDLYSFAGRILQFCPTRGGGTFTNLIGILANGQVNGSSIPYLYEKIKTIMTGKIQFNKDGDKFDIIGGGLSWVHCSTNTATLLRSVLTIDQWEDIELNMMSVAVGWVYRESDIPNRHGYHNSNPNPNLVKTFNGFNLGNTTPDTF